MKAKDEKTDLTLKSKGHKKEDTLLGYPDYPACEDIYRQCQEEREIDPEDISLKKVSNENDGKTNEKDFNEDVSGDDLDIPGAELDDEQEYVGNEDEENNYYSLGGDDNSGLEENNGDL